MARFTLLLTTQTEAYKGIPNKKQFGMIYTKAANAKGVRLQRIRVDK